MANTIIHIGYPRTGTSWFQAKFFPNIENYNLADRKIIQNKLIHPSSLSFSTEEIIKHFNNSNKLIISEEMILGRIRGGAINHLIFKEMIFRLKDVFPKMQVLIFLRNQYEMIQSLYSLYIQKGGTYSLSEFLQPRTRLQELGLYSSAFLDYSLTLKYLSEVIERKNIHVLLYEDFRDNPKKFLAELSARFGFEVDLQNIDATPVNSGLNTRNLSFQRVKNHFTRYGIPFKHYYFHLPGMYSVKSKFPKNTKVYIAPNLPKCIISEGEKFKESNFKVMNNFGLNSMSKYGYPLP